MAQGKVDNHVPLIYFLLKHLYLSGTWFGVDPRINTKETFVVRYWIACARYDNHLNLNSQHN